MKIYIIRLFQITPSLIADFRRKRTYMQLPKKIKQYALIKNLSSGYPFATGIYKDAAGEAVVIKLWQGKRKDLHYYALIHEIAVTKTLTRVQEASEASEKSPVRIPAFIDARITHNRVLLITQCIRGKPIGPALHPKKQWHIYSLCVSYLRELSLACTSAQKKNITVKSGYDFLFLYPFLLLAAIARHPEFTARLLGGIPVFARGLPHLLHMHPTTLVHGDLHPRNVLASGGRYYLVDLEQVRFCYPEYESVVALSLKGNSSEFKKLVMKDLLEKIAQDSGKIKAVATLIINNSTHYLTDNHVSGSVSSYIRAFDTGIKLSNI